MEYSQMYPSAERIRELHNKPHLTKEEYDEYYSVDTPRSLVAEVAFMCQVARCAQTERDRYADLLEIVLSNVRRAN